MGRTGHHLTGLAAGLLVAAAGWHAFGASSLAAVPFGWSGGTAPDWPFHLPAIRFFASHPLEIGGVLRMALAGFTAGGVMHLLMDVPNPTGIPILTPLARSRFGFGWWRSGNALEPLAGLAMAALAGAVLWAALNPHGW